MNTRLRLRPFRPGPAGPGPSRARRGFSAAELCVVVGLTGVLAAVAAPPAVELVNQMTLRAACQDVASIFNAARSRSAFHRVDVAVQWIGSGGDLTYAVYEDGNGNGVLSADIRRGVDVRIQGPISLRGRYPTITFSFVPGFAGLDPSGAPIGNLSDPIRFGRSNLSTFTPLGDASPGSIYLSDQKKRQAVVRVSPMTARIQILETRKGQNRWISRW